IVYLDENYDIYWSITDKYFDDGEEYSQRYGMIMNQVAELEILSESADLPEIHLMSYRRLLGEAISRLLDDEESEIIDDAIHRASKYLNERANESARVWYFRSAVIVVSIVILLMISISLLQVQIHVLDENYFTIVLGSLIGSFGALLSSVQRSSKLLVSPAAGKRVHYLEGATRVIVGIVGAFFVALLMKSNLISLNQSVNSELALIALCFVAGASERMVPGLVSKVEVTTLQTVSSSSKSAVANETVISKTEEEN
ncbi:MAG: hypothetical protein HYZ34_13370, partial [Ignavibacteriae bacterium]|nr:hypothetical protein [Ignavibacteriota bacterium]